MRKENRRNKRIKKLYNEQMKLTRLPLKNPLKIGTRVYITTYREKGYTHENNFVKKTQKLKNSWNMDKVYVISKVIKKRVGGQKDVAYIYKLKEQNGRYVKGIFYREELRTTERSTNTFDSKKDFYNLFLNNEEDLL